MQRLAPGILVVFVTGLACAIGAPLSAATPSAAAAHESAAELMPADLVVVVTLRDGAGQVSGLRRLLVDRRFTESPVYRAIESKPELIQARIGILGLAAAAGVDPWEAASALLGREVAVGIRPGENDASFIAVALSAGGDVTDRTLRQVYLAAGLVRNGEPDPKRSSVYRGVQVFSFGKDLLHARLGDVLILCNNRDLLNDAIDVASGDGASLSQQPAYDAARRRAPADADAWLFTDPQTIRAMAGGADQFPSLMPNPLAGLLFGGWWHDIRSARVADAWITAADGTMSVHLAAEPTEPRPPTHAGFAPADLQRPTWSARHLPTFLGEVSVGRDWAQLFAERESLLTLEAASDFVTFATNLSALMGQLDFVDDLLARVTGPARLLVARQDFQDQARMPSPKLPAFALVAPMRIDGDRTLTRRLYSAASVALSIVSVEQARKDQPSLLLETDEYRGRRIVHAAYPDPIDDDAEVADAGMGGSGMGGGPAPGGLHYNFHPAIAVADDQFIISSTRHFLEQLIDAQDAADAGGRAVADPLEDSLELRVDELAALLGDNREELVADRMLKQDRSRAEAMQDVDLILAALAYFDTLRVTSQADEHGSVGRIDVTLRDQPVPPQHE